MNRISKMTILKEIFLIILSAVLMLGGLAIILTAKLANGIMLVGALAVAAGICIFIYLVRKEIRR